SLGAHSPVSAESRAWCPQLPGLARLVQVSKIASPFIASFVAIFRGPPLAGTGVLGAVLAPENTRKLNPAACDPPLHSTNRAARDLCGGLVGEPTRAYEQKRLTLSRRQAFEGALEIAEVEVLFLATAGSGLILGCHGAHRRHSAALPHHVEIR